MNYFGLFLGLATLLIIGLGFVWVIKGEYYLGYLWWPYIMGLGILTVIGSLFIPSNWGSALMGAFGASLIWGSTELKEQAVRAEIGWYPFNPNPKPNPPLVEKIKKLPPPHL
ncbi:MAG: DUF4491 family protein [Anaerolineales bacterium]|nr:DUF4491 family protein [Anaerolineales bacterium]MCK5427919.1 DUF4491 family protein [Anaerolineales bacterium]